MDFEFTEQQKLFKGTVERLVEREIVPLLAAYPQDKPLPKEGVLKIIQLVRPLGLLGARVPPEDGGSGLDLVSLGIAVEAIPYDAFIGPMTTETVAARLCRGGSARLRKKFLPLLLGGEIIAGSAASEPNVGSDPTGIETKAVLVNDEYIVNGTKLWASSADICNVLHLVASTGRDERGRNILTRFIVERSVSPFQARAIETIGHSQSHLSEVVFEDCRIPKENLIGTPGDAHKVLTTTWLSQRPIVGLQAVHVAQKALDASITYAQKRKQFGRVIGSFQLIQEMIVEMATLVEASRLLAYKALSLVDKGIWSPKESSMAKYFATEAAVKVTSMAIQIHGAYGLSKEYPVERLFRDARMLTIPDGTTEIQKLIIGRELLGIRAFT